MQIVDSRQPRTALESTSNPSSIKISLSINNVNIMRMRGLEPPRELPHNVLNVACLPFHHIRKMREKGVEPLRLRGSF